MIGLLSRCGKRGSATSTRRRPASSERCRLLRAAAHQTFVTPLRADAVAGLGRARMALGREAAALTSLEEADAFWREFAPDNRCAGEVALWLGRTYLALGRRKEANEVLGRAERHGADANLA